jgi:hypothetical protein
MVVELCRWQDGGTRRGGSDLVGGQRAHDPLEGVTLAGVEQRQVLFVLAQATGVEAPLERAEGAVDGLAGASGRLGEPELLQRVALLVLPHVLLQLKQGGVLVGPPALVVLWARRACVGSGQVRGKRGFGRRESAPCLEGPASDTARPPSSRGASPTQGLAVGDLAHAEQHGKKNAAGGAPSSRVGERGVPVPVVLEQAALKASLQDA